MAIGGDSITLTSTTDPLEAVQEALGIVPDAPAAEAAADEAPAADAAAATEEEAPAEKKADAATAAKKADEAPAADADADADDEGDDDDEEAVDVAAHKRARPGSKAQKRISELIRERNTLADTASQTAAELEGLRRRVADERAAAAAKPGAEKTDAVEDPKPTPDTFSTYEEFSDALVQWGVRNYARDAVTNELNARAKAARQHQYTQSMQTASEQYAERLVAAQTKYEDFDKVVQRPDIRISNTMQLGMMTSDMGAEIAYYLGQHPDECRKLFNLGDTPHANRVFGVLEERLRRSIEEADAAGKATTEAEPAPKAKKAKEAKPAAEAAATEEKPAEKKTVASVAADIEAKTNGAATTQKATKLPDPITPSGGGAAASSVPLDQMDYQAYKAARNQQLRERAGLR